MLKHGHCRKEHRTPEYKTWGRMLNRCRNENEKDFHRYGGRGIQVCDQWVSFENFLADVGLRPSANHSIDRYPNNDGNYEPGNVRWATRSEQCRNRRSTRWVTFKGKQISLAEAADATGLPYDTIKQRIAKLGWSDEKALTEPVNG